MEKPPFELHNGLLLALPEAALARLRPFLHKVELAAGTSLYESGISLRHVYFPIDAIVSLLCVIENGASAQIAVVGHEGMVGVAVFMGGDSTRTRAVVQHAGHAWRLPGVRLKEEFDRHAEALVLMLRYTQSLVGQMAQTAVCNRHHSIDQQLCRWLLHTLDRLPTAHLAMTQELIASLLGVRREGVAEAAGKLQRCGAIVYHRGHIEVLDRPLLQRLCCECYAVVKREDARLLGDGPRTP